MPSFVLVLGRSNQLRAHIPLSAEAVKLARFPILHVRLRRSCSSTMILFQVTEDFVRTRYLSRTDSLAVPALRAHWGLESDAASTRPLAHLVTLAKLDHFADYDQPPWQRDRVCRDSSIMTSARAFTTEGRSRLISCRMVLGFSPDLLPKRPQTKRALLLIA